MSRVEVGPGELSKAFKLHRQQANGATASHNLLLFYATECGLKSIWLTNRSAYSSGQYQNELKEHGHDLVQWVKELRLPRNISTNQMRFRVARRDGSYGSDRIHEAWRYGSRVNEGDETTICAWLNDVCTWIEGRL